MKIRDVQIIITAPKAITVIGGRIAGNASSAILMMTPLRVHVRANATLRDASTAALMKPAILGPVTPVQNWKPTLGVIATDVTGAPRDVPKLAMAIHVIIG